MRSGLFGNYGISLGLVLTSLVALTARSEDLSGDYFENLKRTERLELVSQSEVTIPESQWPAPGVDVLTELNKSCGFLGAYQRTEEGLLQIPRVSCVYRKESHFDGMSPKFRCDFVSASGETLSAKVKYANSLRATAKEIAPAVLVSGLSHLMGFVTDIYCPATIICEGCSQDPWHQMQRSAAPAMPDTMNEFRYAVVEMKVPGLKISEPRLGAEKPLGLAWEDLSKVSSAWSPSQQAQKLAEREALMLWMNFIFHTDADAHNNRLICQDWMPHVEGTYICRSPVAYVHDYGDAFLKMNFNNYREKSVFSDWGSWWPVDLFGRCVGSLGEGEGAIRHAVFSEEARLEFMRRFARVSKRQMEDYLNLIHVQEISGFGTPTWVRLFAQKMEEVQNARCESLGTGETVLGKPI